MRNIWRLGAVLFTIGVLSACSNKNETSESTQASNEISLKTAENDAKTVLSYIYDGKVNGVEKVCIYGEDLTILTISFWSLLDIVIYLLFGWKFL